MPNSTQENNFAQMLSENAIDEVKIARGALGEAIEWIAKNLDPEDVFETYKLEAWAESNGYIKEQK